MDSLLVKTTTPSSEPIIDDQATPLPQAKSPEVVVSDSGDRRLSRFGPRQVEAAEQPPCPRCESTNTKFCYYNNYNLSQPRHFCKSCRRYWTRGGALRNVPVGGATRKPYSSNKRPRTTAAAASASTSSSDISNTLVVSCNSDAVMGRTRAPEPVVSVPGLDPRPAQGAAVNLNLGKSGSSSCWWGTSASQMGALPFSGCGIGLGPVVGYEPGILDWPMEPVRVGNGGADLGCSTWEMGGDSDQGGDAAEVDYISWPELAVSTRAKALK